MTHPAHGDPSLNRLAVQATTHCLIGCGIGEVLDSLRFWGSLALALAIAWVVAFPVRWLISRGRGHAVVHGSY